MSYRVKADCEIPIIYRYRSIIDRSALSIMTVLVDHVSDCFSTCTWWHLRIVWAVNMHCQRSDWEHGLQHLCCCWCLLGTVITYFKNYIGKRSSCSRLFYECQASLFNKCRLRIHLLISFAVWTGDSRIVLRIALGTTLRVWMNIPRRIHVQSVLRQRRQLHTTGHSIMNATLLRRPVSVWLHTFTHFLLVYHFFSFKSCVSVGISSSNTNNPLRYESTDYENHNDHVGYNGDYDDRRYNDERSDQEH